MINTLYLPELREMLAGNDVAELREFCTALHPARTAEFMEGLTTDEAWRVLQFADAPLRVEIFGYFPHAAQVEMIATHDRSQVAELVADLSPDDRVDLLHDVPPEIVEELLPLLPAYERRDILRLRSYPEGTAGAVMTTDFAKLSESLTVRDALSELSHQAEELETIYYLYIVDETDHLRGVVSTRQLVSAMGKSETRLGDLMESDVVAVHVLDDQEEVAQIVAHYDLLAIPVVDSERVMLGIITHDDVIDVFREEATEDAYRISAVQPLDEGYLQTQIVTLCRKRGFWLLILFLFASVTAFTLMSFQSVMKQLAWLGWFVPMVISSGGNSGSQSATLVITALATGELTVRDWLRVLLRELQMGLLLGCFLAAVGYIAAVGVRLAATRTLDLLGTLVVPATLVLVVLCGTVLGSVLPLLFRRFGLDPALMSNPFVAGIIDILGILIYMACAAALL